MVRTLTGHTSSVESLVALKNGYLASGSIDKTIKIWNVKWDSKLIQTLTGHTKFIESLLVLKNGYFASGSKDRVRIYQKIISPAFKITLVSSWNDGSSYKQISIFILINKSFLLDQ